MVKELGCSETLLKRWEVKGIAKWMQAFCSAAFCTFVTAKDLRRRRIEENGTLSAGINVIKRCCMRGVVVVGVCLPA
uniref:Transposase n=1 Tax=Syphacia muris TaxID=451379 RepID=A0A0N5A8A1_9BILA